MVAGIPNVYIAQVDCTVERALCANQGIRSYPTIRLYPMGSHGLNSVAWVDWGTNCTQPYNTYFMNSSTKLSSSNMNCYTFLHSMYSDYNRDAFTIRAWLFTFIPSSVIELTEETFERRVLYSEKPWLIDFYTPWCGHCQHFAPEFQLLAQVKYKTCVNVRVKIL